MDTVNGLPAHILLVHGVVVLMPLSALLLVLTACWPAARTRLAAPNAILSVLVVLLVPLTTEAGEWLERRVPRTELLHTHTELGDGAIFYALPIAVLALVIWWRDREARRSGDRRAFLAPSSRAVTGIVLALSLIAGGANLYGIYRIGDSGAKAVWTNGYSQTPSGPEGRDGD